MGLEPPVQVSALAVSSSRRTLRLAGTLYAVGVAVFLVDRITKYLVRHHLAGRPPIVLIPHVLQLSYTTNSGGAFGILANHPWLFFAASVGVALAVVISSARLRATASAVALGLILGGAIGNLVDRLAGPGVGGRVTDFIDFHVWPVFNLADSAIVIGVVVMALAGVWHPTGDRSRRAAVPNDATPAGDG
jgi:signal peptidase II